jgi:NAD(P)H-dependent FMN reductase
MSSRIRVALIYGSTREGRFCDTVAAWAATRIASRSEFALDVIDPAALALRSGMNAREAAIWSCCASGSRRPTRS